MSPEDLSIAQMWFDKMKTLSDAEKWKRLATCTLAYTVYLDNDDTFVTLDCDDDGTYLINFDNYVGSSDGAYIALKAFGINVEHV